MDLLEKWGVREAGLFTFAHSPKHIALYQKFGFWPRFLTAIMSKGVSGREASSIKYSALNQGEQDQAMSACRKLTGSIYEGLDLTSEIRSVKDQNLGETVLMWGGDSLDAFAVCHVAREPKPDEILVLSSLQSSDQGQARITSSNIYGTPAKLSQQSAVCNEWRMA